MSEEVADKVLAVIRSRKTLYEKKAAERNSVEENTANPRDLSLHAAMAMEYLEAEIAALFDADRSER